MENEWVILAVGALIVLIEAVQAARKGDYRPLRWLLRIVLERLAAASKPRAPETLNPQIQSRNRDDDTPSNN